MKSPSIPSAPAALELIAQLKLQYAELRIRVLEEQLRLLRIEKYGAGGEKLSQAQMQLFEFEPLISETTEQAESEVGELLIPMVAAMRRELISGRYIQADETPVDMQTRAGRGKNHQAYLWQYSRPRGSVVFDFRLGRGRDGPKRFLEQFEGILQTDGYAAYDQIGGPSMVHAACWAHARRQFFEAVQLNPQDPVATPIVAQMDELFAVDADARRKTLTTAARHIRRQETARPLLDDIRSKIEAAQSVALPSGALSKACQYTSHFGKSSPAFWSIPN